MGLRNFIQSPATGDITGVTAGVGLSGGGASGAVTLTLDLSELSTVGPANGDSFSTLDSDGSTEQKTTTTALATLFAGTGLTASSSVISVDAAQTGITSVGDLDTGSITSGFTSINVGSGAISGGVITADELILGDAEDISLGAGTDVSIRWSTGDADNHALVIAVGQLNQVLHIAESDDVAVDWNLSANAADPELLIHSSTTPATDYLLIGRHTGSAARIDAVGASTMLFLVGGSGVISHTSGAWSPNGAAGLDLGTSSEGWNDLHLDSLGVINFDGGNITLTHASNELNFSGGNFTVAATNKVIFSGTGSDTYIYEESSDDLHIVVGNGIYVQIDQDLNSIGIGLSVAPTAIKRLELGGAWTSGGGATVAIGTNMSGVLTGAATDTTYIVGTLLGNSITTQSATEDIGNIAQLRINEPTITDNLTGDITIASTLWIHSVPSEGELNNGIYMPAGAIQVSDGQGSSGEQLTSAGVDGNVNWAAASSIRSSKQDIVERTNNTDALAMMVNTPVHDFHYIPDSELPSTGDYETDYVGIIADEAPWAMHHEGRILNPINTFGYTVQAFKALNARIEELEAQLGNSKSG